MPLTAKGEKIKAAMTEQYGAKKGEEVFYASKNAGKITGVDGSNGTSGYEEGGVGAESWVGGRKNSSGYRIVAGDQTGTTPAPVPSSSSSGMSQESPMPVQDMKLPSLDQFRKRFRDAVKAGMPLSKCLDLGTNWTGSSSPKNQKFQADESFRRAFRDALAEGQSIRDALHTADDAAAQKVDLGKTSGKGLPMDKRTFFKGNVRDAMKRGKNFRDAINEALGMDV